APAVFVASTFNELFAARLFSARRARIVGRVGGAHISARRTSTAATAAFAFAVSLSVAGVGGHAGGRRGRCRPIGSGGIPTALTAACTSRRDRASAASGSPCGRHAIGHAEGGGSS